MKRFAALASACVLVAAPSLACAEPPLPTPTSGPGAAAPPPPIDTDEPPAQRATPDGAEARGATAEALTAQGRAAEAVAAWRRYMEVGTEAERAYASMRIAGLGGINERPAATATATAPPGQGDPRRIGLVLPLSGRARVLGEAALRGALLAAGSLASAPGTPKPSPFELCVRDTGSDATRAADLTRDLLARDGVVGVMGALPPAAAQVADGAQAVALTLESDAPAGTGPGVGLVHTIDARARALAQRALALGARSFGILAPDSALGARLAEAFAAAVTQGGGTVAYSTPYPATTTSFGKIVAALKKVPLEALFIAESADRLELVAPALAVADLWSAPWGIPAPKPAKTKPKSPVIRHILVLSTAHGLSAPHAGRVGRYLRGALLAPGFAADEHDPAIAPFVAAHRSAFGFDPGATEAYAYDGVTALKGALAAGSPGRAAFREKLQREGVPFTLTGSGRASPSAQRQDAPLLYTVDDGGLHVVR